MIEKASEKDQLEINWCGRDPYLHLIHTLMDNNNIKHAFLSQNDIPLGHLAIENHKSEDHNPTAWEMIANLWNDLKFMPFAEALGELHSDCSVEELLTFDIVQEMVTATPEKCEEKIISMVLQLNCVISNWERCGQDGEIDEEEEEDGEGAEHIFASFKNHSHHALDQ